MVEIGGIPAHALRAMRSWHSLGYCPARMIDLHDLLAVVELGIDYHLGDSGDFAAWHPAFSVNATTSLALRPATQARTSASISTAWAKRA